jgi:L-Ala-D/L-Glu epimerase
MLEWRLKTYQLDLKFEWKISRSSSRAKKIYIIEVSDGTHQAMGEVAGITQVTDKANELLQQFENFKQAQLISIDELKKCNLEPHLRFGIESAWTHLMAKQKSISVEELLKQKKVGSVSTSFSLPILEINEIEDFFNQFNLKRFSVLKIKIGTQHQNESCKELQRVFKGPIRVDANEAFSTADEVLTFINKIKNLPIEFIEQPLPSDKKEEYLKLKKLSPLKVFADESIQDQDITPDFVNMFDGVNIKLMKSGGYQQALRQIAQAKKYNLKIMLGCMVETSLGISSALHIADNVDYFDLDGFLFFKEDPFHLVKESHGIISSK